MPDDPLPFPESLSPDDVPRTRPLSPSSSLVPFGPPDDQLLLAPGSRPLPEYELVHVLGRGGFGEVWRAQGPGGFDVALKFVRLGAPAGERERTALELMKGIRHAHLLPMFGAWERDGLLIIAMEVADGTLYDRCKQAGGSIPQTELLGYMREAAEGLDFLNTLRDPTGSGSAVGIQHKDVKPQNLMLVGGTLKVADFSLARLLERTQSGMSGGLSPAYAAPEFFHNQVTRWSDQYSLAVTYCALRGKLPFEGTPAQIMVGHLQGAPNLTKFTPAEQVVLGRALAKEPSARWPSCREFVAALEAAATGARLPGSGGRVAWPWIATSAVMALVAITALLLNQGPSWLEFASRVPPPSSARQESGLAADTSRDRPHGPASTERVAPRSTTPPTTAYIAPPKTTPPPLPAPPPPTPAATSRRGSLKAPGARPPHPSPPPQESVPESIKPPVSGSSSAPQPKPAPRAVQARQATPLDCTGADGVGEAAVRAAQEVWATYLGCKVEEEVSIGNGVTMTFILIPPGKFRMGSPPEEKERSSDENLHVVTLLEPFYLGKTEVTQDQYTALTARNPSRFQGKDSPVENVSWEEARDYAAQLTKKLADKYEYRLPTEAEWEYACRGGRPCSLPFGIGVDGQSLGSRQANFDGNFPYGEAVAGPYLECTCPVASYRANALGLYDMHGNVAEWCADWWGPNRSDPVTNPVGPATGEDRVYRGGNWLDGAGLCRAANRGLRAPASKADYIGFRLARSLPGSRPHLPMGEPITPPAPPTPPPEAIERPPPPLNCGAKDLSAEAVQQAQKAWARYLKRKVIETVDLGAGVQMELVLIPPGIFTMGSLKSEDGHLDDEEPIHGVELTQPFWMGKFEVTVEQFRRFVAAEDYKEAQREQPGRGYDKRKKIFSPGREYTWKNTGFTQLNEHPVVNVNWNDAQAFCGWMSGKAKGTVHLPTEAQWEYGCRAGTTTRFYSGNEDDDLKRVGNIADQSFLAAIADRNLPDLLEIRARVTWNDGSAFTAPVGQFKPNAFGLYDMHGNAAEWCADWYGKYPATRQHDPKGPDATEDRVVRGGSFSRAPGACRSARRDPFPPSYRDHTIGFRVILLR